MHGVRADRRRRRDTALSELRRPARSGARAAVRAVAPDPSAAGIFRYASLLPAVPAAARVSLAEGRTPLLGIPAAGARRRAFRSCSPRTSRATRRARSRIARWRSRASVARSEGAPGIVCASTGNAGASAAAYGARAGLPVVILVPVGTPPPKMAQAAVCGARVVAVQGTYSDAWSMAAAISASLGWLNATTTFTCPYVVEATRTVAYEIFEQIGVPDWIAVPIGAGPLLVGIHEGFEDLRGAGGGRAGAAPARAPAVRVRADRAGVRGGRADPAVGARRTTVAGGLADPLAGYPDEGDVTVRAIVASGGAAIAVDDEATIAAISMLAGREGLFQEPASAIAIAGVAEARRRGLIGEVGVGRRVPDGHRAQGPVRRRGWTARPFPVAASLADLEQELART